MSFAKPKQQKEPQAEPGIHAAVCVGVWDLGLQAPSGAFAGGKPSEKVMLAWENPEGVLITADYTRIIDAWKDKEGNIQQTKLKKTLESWYFHSFIFPITSMGGVPNVEMSTIF